MRTLLPLALCSALLAACAPAVMAPAPQPGEVIITAVDTLPHATGSTLSTEQKASIVAFADISAMLIIQRNYYNGLPLNYDEFRFPDDEKSIQFLGSNDKDSPVHGVQDWQAKQKDGQGVVNVHWESMSLKGQFVSVRVQATSTDPAVSPRQVEDALLKRLYRFDGINLVASGR